MNPRWRIGRPLPAHGSNAGLAFALALALALALLPSVGWPVTLQVAPLRVALMPGHPVVAMTVGNGDDAEMAVQAEVFAWSQEDGNDVYRPTTDVLVNPAIFRLAPQGQQILRVGLQVPAGTVERSYRIFLRQLPAPAKPAPEGTGPRLQTLLRVGIPIFVPPQGGAASDLHWHLEADAGRGAGRYDLVVDNHGTAHVQLTRVAATKVDGGGATVKSLSHYVLAGQSTVVPIELPPLAADASLRIEAQGDDVGATPPAVVQVPRVPVAISR